MITRIKIRNFKSLADFEVSDLSAFTCLIGLNGSGKSTLLQFLDFVQAILKGNISDWLTRHKWKPTDLISLGTASRTIDFELDITREQQRQTWQARLNLQELRCVYETLTLRQDSSSPQQHLLTFKDNQLILKEKIYPLPPAFRHEGSIFSILELTDDFFAFQELLQTKAFGVLDPAEASQATQISSKSSKIMVEENGKGLIGFISQLTSSQQNELFQRLQTFYPDAHSFKIKSQRFGWKSLLLNEKEKSHFDASHLSYGTLRILVFLSQWFSDNQCVVFDEIENGINQEIMATLLKLLLDFNGKQVIITTHSALLINYLPDDIARKNIFFLYKDANGSTHAKRFFDMPPLADKLNLLGPGEAMASVDLVQLSRQLANANE